jgi:hypothetical protein
MEGKERIDVIKGAVLHTAIKFIIVNVNGSKETFGRCLTGA